MTTTYGVAPREADWYYCAIIDRAGETDYIDGYATGDRPTRTGFRAHTACAHRIIEWTVKPTPHGAHASKRRAARSAR